MSASALVRPALGLLLLGGAIYGVLESGRGLRAPPPLAATWRVESNAGCLGDTIELTQSGVYLHGRSGEHTVRGKLDGERVWVGVTCAGGRAALTGSWTPERLSATTRSAGCGCEGLLAAEPAP